jgi:hypothetical protein
MDRLAPPQAVARSQLMPPLPAAPSPNRRRCARGWLVPSWSSRSKQVLSVLERPAISTESQGRRGAPWQRAPLHRAPTNRPTWPTLSKASRGGQRAGVSRSRAPGMRGVSAFPSTMAPSAVQGAFVRAVAAMARRPQAKSGGPAPHVRNLRRAGHATRVPAVTRPVSRRPFEVRESRSEPADLSHGDPRCVESGQHLPIQALRYMRADGVLVAVSRAATLQLTARRLSRD